MPEWLKEMLENAEKEGAEVHVVHVNSDEPKDEYADVKEEAKEIAELNKILYEAHIEVGFTSEEALELTMAVIR